MLSVVVSNLCSFHCLKVQPISRDTNSELKARKPKKMGGLFAILKVMFASISSIQGKNLDQTDNDGNFWSVSTIVFSKIESDGYLEN